MGNLPAPPQPPLPPQPQDCGDQGASPTTGVPADEEETGSSAIFSTKNFMSNEISGFLDQKIKRRPADGQSIEKGHEKTSQQQARKRTPSKEFLDRIANSSFSKMIPPKKQEVEDSSQIGDGETREEMDQAGCLFIQS